MVYGLHSAKSPLLQRLSIPPLRLSLKGNFRAFGYTIARSTCHDLAPASMLALYPIPCPFWLSNRSSAQNRASPARPRACETLLPEIGRGFESFHLNALIEHDRFPLSARIRVLRGIRAKLPRCAPLLSRRRDRRHPRSATEGGRRAKESDARLGSDSSCGVRRAATRSSPTPPRWPGNMAPGPAFSIGAIGSCARAAGAEPSIWSSRGPNGVVSPNGAAGLSAVLAPDCALRASVAGPAVEAPRSQG
jgi:hypothetical protein